MFSAADIKRAQTVGFKSYKEQTSKQDKKNKSIDLFFGGLNNSGSSSSNNQNRPPRY